MPSPFPGMDPYLEGSLWATVHFQLSAEIARQLARSPSTISRELRRNAATRSGDLQYRATTAQWHADRKARRPKTAKLARHAPLRQYVQDRLAGTITAPGGQPVVGPSVRWIGRRHGRRQHRRWGTSWSPEQIAQRLSAWQAVFVAELRRLLEQFTPGPLDLNKLPSELRSHYVSTDGTCDPFHVVIEAVTPDDQHVHLLVGRSGWMPLVRLNGREIGNDKAGRTVRFASPSDCRRSIRSGRSSTSTPTRRTRVRTTRARVPRSGATSRRSRTSSRGSARRGR